MFDILFCTTHFLIKFPKFAQVAQKSANQSDVVIFEGGFSGVQKSWKNRKKLLLKKIVGKNKFSDFVQIYFDISEFAAVTLMSVVRFLREIWQLRRLADYLFALNNQRNNFTCFQNTKFPF